MSTNCHVHYTLTRHDAKKHAKWKGLTGRINLSMMQKCGLPKPDYDMIIIICGPDDFNRNMIEILSKAGYKQNREFFTL